jgi:hypothetical protein
MLVLTGLSSPVCGCNYGLGYVESVDFTCVRSNNLFICKPKTATVLASFKGLQQAVKNVSQAMADAGRLDVPSSLATLDVDGRIGGITTLGTRFIVAALVPAASRQNPPQPVPAEVLAILEQGLTKEEETRRVAAGADTIAAFIVSLATNFPAVLVSDPIVIVRETPADLEISKSSISPKVGMALGGVGIILIAIIASIVGKVSSGSNSAAAEEPEPQMKGARWRYRARPRYRSRYRGRY